MGFDPYRVPYLKYYLDRGDIALGDIEVVGDLVPETGFFESSSRYLAYKAPAAWTDLEV